MNDVQGGGLLSTNGCIIPTLPGFPGDLSGTSSNHLLTAWPPFAATADTAGSLLSRARARLAEVRTRLAEVESLKAEEKQLEAMIAAAELVGK